MTEPTPREKNIKDQYEALGRFVEAFEHMVHEVRTWVIILLGMNEYNYGIPQIVAHSPAMTAKPLFDVFRAMVAVLVTDPLRDPDTVPEVAEGKLMLELLAQFSKEYMDLANTRNNLLHGTWHMGSGWDNEDGNSFTLIKLSPAKTGLIGLALPRTSGELNDLTDRCKKLREQIEVFGRSLRLRGRLWMLTEVFVLDGDEYRLA